MSKANSVGIDSEKRNSSCGRGRGKRNNQHTIISENRNIPSESKSESQLKIDAENNLLMAKRVSRGRGWKRPDKPLYVPRALRKQNHQENADSLNSEDTGSRREDETGENKNRDKEIFSNSEDFLEQTCDQAGIRLHPEEEKVLLASDKEESRSCIPNDEGTDHLLDSLSNVNISNDLQADETTINKKGVEVSCLLKQDFNLKEKIAENIGENEEQMEERRGEKDSMQSVLRDLQNGNKLILIDTSSTVVCMQSSGSRQDMANIRIKPCIKGFAETDNIQEEKQNLRKNQDDIRMRVSAMSVDQIQEINTCQLVAGDSVQENQKQSSFEKQDNITMRESVDSIGQIHMMDTCQSNSSVEEQTSMKNEDKKENVAVDQQLQVFDTCHSKSPIKSYADSNNPRELSDEQRQVLENHQTSLLLEKLSVGEDLQKEKSALPEELGQGKDEQTQVTNTCQSSKYNIDVSSGRHIGKSDLHSENTTAVIISSKEDVTLGSDSKTEKESCVYNMEYLQEESSYNNTVIDDISEDVADQLCGSLNKNTENFDDEKKGTCLRTDIISDEKCSEIEEGKSEFMENNENQSEKNKMWDLMLVNTKVENPEPETEKIEENFDVLDVGNNDEIKMGSCCLTNEKKVDEKETKQKKKGKKKKGMEVESKDEKKKKKSKKKETVNEEIKDEEKDEKHGKLKRKSKKKESKENSDSKQPDELNGKCNEKIKDKKLDKSKNGSDNNDDEESWESKFNEDGDCLDPELLQELTEVTGIKKPSKHKTQFDYYSLPSREVYMDDESEYGHIVELYDFSPELKTQDLAQLLSSFKSQGYEIKWVDDTHALAVFSSEIAAKQAVQMCCSPIIKLRPVSQGISESKNKAKRCFSSLQPYKPRPQTTKLAAHRLVTGALGVKSTMSKEEREREREKLKEAKEQKRQEKQRKADIWGD